MPNTAGCFVRPSDGCTFALSSLEQSRRAISESSLAADVRAVYSSSPVLKSDAPKAERARLLEKLGVPPIDPTRRPDAFAEIRRIACRLHRTGHRSIGFVPADDRVGAIALALQVALAMDQLHGALCSVLDLNAVRPQFARHPEFASVPADAFGFRTVWVADRVTLSTPALPSKRLVFAELEQVARRAIERYDRVFIDLTGLALWGEHLPAYQLVDGIAVIANTNKSLERDILRCADEIPPEQFLGVVLVG